MSEDKAETVERSYAIRKDLNKRLDYIKIETERGKAELVNEAIEQYVNATAVPLLGHVSAGPGIPANEDIEEHIRLPGWLANGARFALRVRGQSMEPTLWAGDVVGVVPEKSTKNGALVVALRAGSQTEVEDSEREGVIKRIVKDEHEAYLKGDNPVEERVPLLDYQIIGRVVCVLRVL